MIQHQRAGWRGGHARGRLPVLFWLSAELIPSPLRNHLGKPVWHGLYQPM